jgi:hypothetical protein
MSQDNRNLAPYQSFFRGGMLTTGNVFFVDSGAALAVDSPAHGDSPLRPFATIEGAMNDSRLTANNGDIVYAMPGHAETVSAAGGLDLDIAGVKVIGLGEGPDQPTITLDTATTADVDIDAAGVILENLHFIAAFADIVAAIDVNSTDFVLRGCRFTQSGADLNALIWVQDAAAAASDRITIEDCHVIAYDAANTHFVNFAGTGTGHVIQRNTLLGDWGTMAIGGAGIITRCYIAENNVYNLASDSLATINVGATATGIIARNHCGAAAAQTQGLQIGDCTASENYYSVVSEELQGVLDPIAT